MDFYSIGVNHEAGPYRKNKTAPISMTSDTYLKTLLPAIFSALHNQTCWYLHSLFFPSQKHYFYSVCKNALHKTPEHTDKFKLCSLQQKQDEHGCKKTTGTVFISSIWRGEWFVAKKCHFWSLFLGFWVVLGWGSTFKAQGFKQLQKLHGGSDPKLRDRPVEIPSWISEQQRLLGFCWVNKFRQTDLLLCIFSIWILIHWILWKCWLHFIGRISLKKGWFIKGIF